MEKTILNEPTQELLGNKVTSSGGIGGTPSSGFPGMSYDTPCLQEPKPHPSNSNQTTQTKLTNPINTTQLPQKITTTIKPKRIRKLLQTCILFTPNEYAQLQKDSQTSGKTIPQLLKRTYFKGPLPAPLLPQDDFRALHTEIRRIGNNVNQIARALNSGIREGFHKELEDVKEQLLLMLNFLGGFCGVR